MDFLRQQITFPGKLELREDSHTHAVTSRSLWLWITATLLFAMCCAKFAFAAEDDAESAFDSEPIESYWDTVFEDEDVKVVDEYQDNVDLEVEAPEQNFLDHLFIRVGADYTFNFADYTGEPTRTFVVDGFTDLDVTPEGFVYGDTFDQYDTRFDSYVVAGTRGYYHSRLNTYFSAVYQNSDTLAGSPFQGFADAFGRGDYSELVNAFAELTSLSDDGYLANTSARFGRQYMFDTSPHLLGSPLVDGGMARYTRPKLDVELFAGRHVNSYSKPQNDIAVGISGNYQFREAWWAGVNFLKLAGETRSAVELRHLGDRWSGRGYLTVRGRLPSELGVDLWYTPAEIPLRAELTVIRRLSDEGFVFDVFRARDDLKRRLRMGELNQSTLMRVEADYDVLPWMTLGGTAEHYNSDESAESAFDNTFTELSGRMYLTPLDRFDVLMQYSLRTIDRSNLQEVLAATTFDDITHAGENLYREFLADLHYRINERTSVNAGGHYTLVNSRTRLAQVSDSDAIGFYVRAQSQVRRWLHLKLEYSWDKPNPDFYPELDSQSSVRLGLEYRYN